QKASSMTRTRFVAAAVAALAIIVVFLLYLLPALGSAEAKPFGIEKRIPLTTSTVVGSPDPPLPFRAIKDYKDLTIPFPVAIKHQPDSDRYLFISEDKSYGPTRLHRMKIGQKDSDFETLLDMK